MFCFLWLITFDRQQKTKPRFDSRKLFVNFTLKLKVIDWIVVTWKSYLLIIMSVLIVKVTFECQFCSTSFTFKTSGVEKCEILEWSNPVDLIYDFIASKASWLVEVWTIHCWDNLGVWQFFWYSKFFFFLKNFFVESIYHINFWSSHFFVFL